MKYYDSFNDGYDNPRRKTAQICMFLLAGAMMIGAIIMLVLGFVAHKEYNNPDYIPITAQICEINEVPSNDFESGVSHGVFYSYEYEGKDHIFEGSVYSSSMQVGDEKILKINPATDEIVEDSASVFFIVGGIFMLVGVMMFTLMLIYVKKHRDM